MIRAYDDDRGRIKRIREYLEEDTFLLTYGDGVSDVNIAKLVKFHRAQKNGSDHVGAARRPLWRAGYPGRRTITNFRKRKEDGGWINAGFMVLEPEMIDLIEGDETVFERYPAGRLPAALS